MIPNRLLTAGMLSAVCSYFNWPIPWSRVTFLQLAIQETYRRFIAVFTRARDWSMLWARL